MDVSPDSALELIRSGKASRAEKIFLADGLLTMDTMRLLQCLTILGFDEDGDVRDQARRTLCSLPPTDIVDAASSSGLPTESAVEFYARLTILSKDVLRKIGSNREWSRNPSVVTALLGNPKTPLGLSMKIVGRLGVKDLKTVATSRNLPEALRHAAGTLYQARRDSGV